jgi:hypothetical protein
MILRLDVFPGQREAKKRAKRRKRMFRLLIGDELAGFGFVAAVSDRA